MPERHVGSSQLHKCFVVDFGFDFALSLTLSLLLVGVPVGRDMKKVVFCILSKYLTSACLRHDFYVVPSSEALQKTTFFMPFGGSFSLGYLFFWTSKRKGTTLAF